MFAATPRELGHIQEYAERYSELSLSTLTHIKHQGVEMPIQQLSFGSSHPSAPCLILTGSIHGVERIGSQIILAFIRSLLKRRQWDSQLNDTLNKIRILTVPVVNPWGSP
ncbi:zinc carboxypeptidase-related protein [Vibrio maritimus]|uniref:Zinc carboxypeptidase-related protein n=1 Tax=Vibrio maritimus TaxID=990268 RepID=A0A090T9J3_9VIBR|nr:zinc carboxypeptidase-related protein [Vibrio maritimus]